MHIPGSNIIVVGMGRSGVSSARFLKDRGAAVTITDAGDASAFGPLASDMEARGIRTALGGHPASLLDGADTVVLSPGVPLTIPFLKEARSRKIPVIGEIELASRFVTAPMVAITGTNGKTTVTELTGRMLEASGFSVFVGGNIGTPLIDHVANGEAVDRLVVEVSSFQLDTTRDFHPNVAVLLNITEDHLDRYDGMDGYAKSKARIFENQSPEDIAVVNAEDPRCVAAASSAKSRRLLFGRRGVNGPGALIDGDRLILRRDGAPEIALSTAGSPMPGGHNRENCAAAALAALATGATPEGIQTAIDGFPGLPHRLTFVAEVGGVRYVDDSKATNLDAVRRAVAAFTSPIILIMGGRGKGYNFTALADALRDRVRKIVAIGETANQIAAELENAVGGVIIASGMEAAVKAAHRSAAPGDVVLLSPACASFDMFDNYGHRGDAFALAVKALSPSPERDSP